MQPKLQQTGARFLESGSPDHERKRRGGGLSRMQEGVRLGCLALLLPALCLCASPAWAWQAESPEPTLPRQRRGGWTLPDPRRQDGGYGSSGWPLDNSRRG